MPIHFSLAYTKAEGYRLTAFCQTQPPRGEIPCRHSQELDWDKLIEVFGEDFVIPKERPRFLAALKCSKCGGRDVEIIMTPPSGYRG